jgi:hypothetical protein
LKFFLENEKINSAMDFFENEVENEGYIPNTYDLDRFISYYCSNNEIDFAFKLVNQFENKFGIICGSFQYNHFVLAYLEMGQDDKAMEVISKMKSISIPPNYVTYEAMLKFYLEYHKYKDAVALLALWRKEANIKQTSVSLVENYFKIHSATNYLNCIEFLDKLAGRKFDYDVFYMAFFQHFVNIDPENSIKFVRLLEVKKRIKGSKCSKLYNFLVVKYLEINEIEKSQYILSQLPRGMIRLTTAVAVLKNHFNNDEYEKANLFFEHSIVLQQNRILELFPEHFQGRKVQELKENQNNSRMIRTKYFGTTEYEQGDDEKDEEQGDDEKDEEPDEQGDKIDHNEEEEQNENEMEKEQETDEQDENEMEKEQENSIKN